MKTKAYVITRGGLRWERKRYTSYEQARSALRKILRTFGFSSGRNYHNPSITGTDFSIKVV